MREFYIEAVIVAGFNLGPGWQCPKCKGCYLEEEQYQAMQHIDECDTNEKTNTTS